MIQEVTMDKNAFIIQQLQGNKIIFKVTVTTVKYFDKHDTFRHLFQFKRIKEIYKEAENQLYFFIQYCPQSFLNMVVVPSSLNSLQVNEKLTKIIQKQDVFKLIETMNINQTIDVMETSPLFIQLFSDKLMADEIIKEIMPEYKNDRTN